MTKKNLAPELASHMLVVMVRAIQKPSFTYPVAQFPSANLTGSQPYPLLWNVIEALELNDIHVVSYTCDGVSSNRNFYILFVRRKGFYLTRLKTPIDHHIVFISFVMSLTYLKHQEIALLTHLVTHGAAI